MDNKSLKSKAISGLVWTFAERILAQGVSFIVSVILARLLMPEEYGTVAMIMVFITIANVFVSNGLGEAIVQKHNPDEKDYNSVFWCSMGLAVVLYGLMFFTAPLIADFYENSTLVPLIRVLSLKLPLAGINTLQRAYVQKHMQFRKFFYSTLIGTVVSGFVGIGFAYAGFGVWALVFQYLSNSTIDTIVLWLTVEWKPEFQFSWERAKTLIGYGWKLMAASLLNTFYDQARSLIIGKKYSPENLAFYNKGNQLPSLLITNVNVSISSVAFPVMAAANENLDQLKSISRRAMKTSAFIIFPAMAGLIGIAKPLIRLLLTEKWLPCVPFLRLNCIYWMFQPVQTANWQIIKAMGRSDLCFKLEIAKKIIGFAIILTSVPFGVMAVAASNVCFAGISMLINIIPTRKLIGYTYREQFTDIFPSLAGAAVMGIFAAFFQKVIFNDWLLISVQVIAGIMSYVLISWLMKNESLKYIWNIIKSCRRKQ